MAAMLLKGGKIKAEKDCQNKTKKDVFGDWLILIFMPAKQNRLVKEKDFKKIFKQGKSFYAKNFQVKVLVNKLEINRYGIVISNKVSKKSVKRNKLKRQFRATINEFDKELIKGIDLVIIVFPAALSQEYKFIKSELKKNLFALKLFQSDK